MFGVGEQGGTVSLHQRREAEQRGGASRTCATTMPMATSNWRREREREREREERERERRGREGEGEECVLLNF